MEQVKCHNPDRATWNGFDSIKLKCLTRGKQMASSPYLKITHALRRM